MKPWLSRVGLLIGGAAGALLVAAADSAPTYRTIEVVKGGKVRGRVTLVGAPPPGKQRPEKRPEVCTAPAAEQTIVDKEGNLANAIVYLKDITAGKRLVPGHATLEQSDCSYVPHLQAVPLGTTLTITNRDPVMHCAHGFVDGTMAFNHARPVKDQPMDKVLDKAGFTEIRCEIHQWMTSVVAVMPSPYYAVSGADGTFEITDIPPGTYTLGVWHEVLGELARPIVVAPDGDATVEFAFKGSAKPKRP